MLHNCGQKWLKINPLSLIQVVSKSEIQKVEGDTIFMHILVEILISQD